MCHLYGESLKTAAFTTQKANHAEKALMLFGTYWGCAAPKRHFWAQIP